MIVLVANAACTPPAPSPEPTPAPASLRGLLVLGGGGHGARLEAWLGAGPHPERSTIAVAPTAEWIVASSAGRLATLDAADRLRVSSPLTSTGPSVEPEWRDVELASDGTPLFGEGQIDLPAWDPTGSRLALTIGTGYYGYGLLIVDADTGASHTIRVAGAQGVFDPVWLDSTTVAVTTPHVTASEPVDGASAGIDFSFSTSLVNTSTGAVEPGPERQALAGSSDGTLVITTAAWGEPGTLAIQTRDAWLRGSDEVVASFEALADARSDLIVTFDQTGTRAAVAWWTGDDAMENATMTVRVYDAGSDWKPVAELPVTESWPVQLAWLP